VSEHIPSEQVSSEHVSSEHVSSEHVSSDKRSKLPPFDPSAVTHAAGEALNVRRVFGEAYERDGTWVIPVAKIAGGTGSGFGGGAIGGNGPAAHRLRGESKPVDVAPSGEGEGSGGGGGFGIRVRPIGVYVIDDGACTGDPRSTSTG